MLEETIVTVWINESSNHFRRVSPGEVKRAVHISCFLGDIFVEFGEGGGDRQIEGEPLIDRLCTGGVLNYTQHPRLLSCILDLRIKNEKKQQKKQTNNQTLGLKPQELVN